MIADFIGGPWHLTSKVISHVKDKLYKVIEPQVPSTSFVDPKQTVPKPSLKMFEYVLTIQTRTYCVYVVDSLARSHEDCHLHADICDPVRYYFAREDRFREEIKGWTHHNPDLAAASVDGIRGMLAIQRFRKRK